MLGIMFRPTTIVKAFSLATLYESANQSGAPAKPNHLKGNSKSLLSNKLVSTLESQVDSTKGK